MANEIDNITLSAKHYAAVDLAKSEVAVAIYDKAITLGDIENLDNKANFTPVKPIFYIKPYVMNIVRDALEGESSNAIMYQGKRYMETGLDDIRGTKVIIKSRIITSHIKTAFVFKSFVLMKDINFIDEYNVTGGYPYTIQVLESEETHSTDDLNVIDVALMVDFRRGEV